MVMWPDRERDIKEFYIAVVLEDISTIPTCAIIMFSHSFFKSYIDFLSVLFYFPFLSFLNVYFSF